MRVLLAAVNCYGHAPATSAWPTMEARRSGSIVLISSMAAHRGSLVLAPEYSASKGALESLNPHSQGTAARWASAATAWRPA